MIAAREEERAAQRKLRAVRKAQRARSEQAAAHRAETIRAALREPWAKTCRCGITPHITLDELRALGAGCTGSRGLGHPGYVCPTLDRIRRRLGR